MAILTFFLLRHSCRKIFVFLQSTVAMVAKGYPELGVNLYIDLALAADGLAVNDKGRNDSNTFTQIAYELMTQGILLHEEDISDAKSQERSVIKIIGALIAFETLSNDEYERLITKAAQFSAKLVRKQEQCRMVALCAHLFYPGVSFGVDSIPKLSCIFSNLVCINISRRRVNPTRTHHVVLNVYSGH